MSMTQRYAGFLRRTAAEWDKQANSVRAEATRQAALHMERREVELCHQLVNVRETLEHECIDGDALLRLLDMDPEQYRTEAGRLNLLKIRADLADRKTHNARLSGRQQP